MKAVQIAISKTYGLLYVDNRYQCWVSYKQDSNELSALYPGEDVRLYTTNGFGEHSAETIAELIRVRVYELCVIGNVSYPVIHNLYPGKPYMATVNNWYEQVILHPCLVQINDASSSRIGLIKEIQYEGNAVVIVTSDEQKFALTDVVPLSDLAIDALKTDIHLDNLTRSHKPVICFNRDDGIHFAIEPSSVGWGSMITTDRYPPIELDEVNQTLLIPGTKDFTIDNIPITHEQLDAYKCGL